MAKAIKHSQTSKLIVLKDLFKCIEQVDDVEFILGISADCDQVVKISIEDLAALIAATPDQ